MTNYDHYTPHQPTPAKFDVSRQCATVKPEITALPGRQGNGFRGTVYRLTGSDRRRQYVLEQDGKRFPLTTTQTDGFPLNALFPGDGRAYLTVQGSVKLVDGHAIIHVNKAMRTHPPVTTFNGKGYCPESFYGAVEISRAQTAGIVSKFKAYSTRKIP